MIRQADFYVCSVPAPVNTRSRRIGGDISSLRHIWSDISSLPFLRFFDKGYGALGHEILNLNNQAQFSSVRGEELYAVVPAKSFEILARMCYPVT